MNVTAASGKNGRQKRRMPYPPIFSSTPARITEPAVGASTWASGSQVCTGNIGTLMAKATKKARKAQNWMWYVYTCRPSSWMSKVMWPRPLLAAYTTTMMAISMSRLPTSVKRKNLMAA